MVVLHDRDLKINLVTQEILVAWPLIFPVICETRHDNSIIQTSMYFESRSHTI